MPGNNHELQKPSSGPLRCAIYTRKSTEEGLDQEFNSLDAQREAAQSFILSQRREGWVALPELYDDGGFTGANMDRPALTRLLRDVEAGVLDCVVVYKVDRLSRSLLDFSRMLSIFEKHNVSFVAVTQQFNTSTSLGRLTLNILLSFAQFERELIGERTRDKISAARKKGKWVGGCPVLGYDVGPGGGHLVVNEDEAAQVRQIFGWFDQHGSGVATLAEIERCGWRLKAWTRKTGQFRPGGRIGLDALRRLLTNVIYTGKIRHKGESYPGEHAAILEPGIWDRVQKRLEDPAALARGKLRNKHLALLNGLLYCDACAARMVYTYAAKNGRKYPYYLCLNAQRKGWAACPAKSLPAQAIEESVLKRIRAEHPEMADRTRWEQMKRADQVRARIKRGRRTDRSQEMPEVVRNRQSGQTKATWSGVLEIVREFGCSLPDVKATTRYDGSPVLKAQGAFMAGLAMHASAEPGTLVVRTTSEERAVLLEDAPDIYYITDYYRRHPVVLVRLKLLSREVLREVLTGSWRLTIARSRKRRPKITTPPFF